MPWCDLSRRILPRGVSRPRGDHGEAGLAVGARDKNWALLSGNWRAMEISRSFLDGNPATGQITEQSLTEVHGVSDLSLDLAPQGEMGGE